MLNIIEKSAVTSYLAEALAALENCYDILHSDGDAIPQEYWLSAMKLSRTIALVQGLREALK